MALRWAEISCQEEGCLDQRNIDNLKQSFYLSIKYRSEMEQTVITPCMIQEFHKQILFGNRHAGIIRHMQEVCTVEPYTEKLHFYPKPMLIEEQLLCICDATNKKIVEWRKRENKRDFTFIEIVAWTCYNIVSLHPFTDGNGRLTRLVAAFLLMDIVDYPITIISDNWVQALVAIRNSFPRHAYFPINCDPTPLTMVLLYSINERKTDIH